MASVKWLFDTKQFPTNGRHRRFQAESPGFGGRDGFRSVKITVLMALRSNLKKMNNCFHY